MKLDPATCSGRDALFADWLALGHASDIGAIWPAFWRVFWATLSEPREGAPAAMPNKIVPLAAPVATAAHPRAYQGTKFSPPKAALPALDLYAWMADDRLLDGFFARHDFVRWPVLGIDGHAALRDAGAIGAPTVAALLASHGMGDAANVPAVFRRHFLWLLRAGSTDERRAWLRLWRALGAPAHGTVLATLARLCALDTGAHRWAELALHLPQSRQELFLLRVLRRASYRLDPALFSGEQAGAFDAISDDDAQFDACIDIALDNLNRGVRIAYTLAGCRLPGPDSLESWARGLRATVDADALPIAAIARMLAAVGNDGTYWARIAWAHCATQAGYAHFLSETSWESMTRATATWWLQLLTVNEWDHARPALCAAQAKVRIDMFAALHRALRALPGDRQEKFARVQWDHVCGWDDPATLGASWPVLLALQARLCQLPFLPRARGDFLLSTMAMQLPASGWQQLAALPDQAWLTIERACRRDNDATLIRHGLHGVTEVLPDVVLRSLARAPTRLMRSMALVGCLEYHARRRFLAQAARTPWFARAWDDVAAVDACRELLALCVEYGVDSPLPRRLRKHLDGVVTLSAAQVTRHCRVTLARLPSTQLAALDAMAWRHIDGPFDLRKQSAAAHHAVRLHASIDGGNKKALRRFLLGYAAGGIHAYLDHPLNRAWYARHPAIDGAVWGTGSVRHDASDAGVTIAIETDPLEVLMLGSYVGSCLGLGGSLEYSTVACLVDANKQVAYARDAAGRVVGRQLLAIDERERLVSFGVYPETHDARMLRAFARFDEQLAKALGVEIYRDDGAGYDVVIILAMEWWDDGPWNDAACT